LSAIANRLRPQMGTKAATLGWNAVQLFGCHREWPSIVQWWGAMWLISGGEIVALSVDVIRIKTVRGAQQSIRKTDHTCDFTVPVWALC
jgi:hypothetical protein